MLGESIQRACGLVSTALLLLVAGCGDGRPPLYPVGGTVVFDAGDPVRNATIELVPKVTGPCPRGRVDAEGRFVLGTYAADDGAHAGEYRVVVVQTLEPVASVELSQLGEAHAGHSGFHVVALKHASPDTSGVSYTVVAPGTQSAEIVVEAR